MRTTGGWPGSAGTLSSGRVVHRQCPFRRKAVVPAACTFDRRCNSQVRTLPDDEVPASVKDLAEAPPLKQIVTIPPGTLDDMLRWASEVLANVPVQIKPNDPPTLIICVDVSAWGWGRELLQLSLRFLEYRLRRHASIAYVGAAQRICCSVGMTGRPEMYCDRGDTNSTRVVAYHPASHWNPEEDPEK